MAVKSLVRSGVDNFEKYSSLLAGNIGYDTYFEHITTTTLGSAVASVTFSDLDELAGTYQHLQIRAAVRGTGAGSLDYLSLRFNGDTGTNYNTHLLYGDGTSVNSGGDANSTGISNVGMIPSANSTANSFGGVVLDILDPYETTKNTTTRSFSGFTGGQFVALMSGAWRNTSAISSITFYERDGGGFAQFSRFSLYGLR